MFVQHFEGVIPRILTGLKAQRALVRRQQKNIPSNSLQWNILEFRQKGIKLTANSMYGFFGAVTKGILPCVEISESTTCIGREMILETKAFVENDFAIYTSNEFIDMVNSTIENPDLRFAYIPRDVIGRITRAMVIYGDTDSVMSHYVGLTHEVEDIKWCHRIGRLASIYITGKFKKHAGDQDVILEYEKCYCPYLLLTKKRYAGMLWTKDHRPDKRDSKGLPDKKRDNWIGLRETYSDCLDALLEKRNLELAKKIVMDLLANVVANALPISAYVISKCLKKDYSKSRSVPPHVVVRDKKRKRAPGSEPKSGNRVPFVITEDRTQDKVSPRAEDPDFVLENMDTVHIDRLYYIETLEKPFCTLFEPCFQNPEMLFKSSIQEINAKRKGLQDISQWIIEKHRSPPSPSEVQLTESEKIMNSVKRRDTSVAYVPKLIQKENKKKRKLAEKQIDPLGAFFITKPNPHKKPKVQGHQNL
jgi:DNA polymerase delta subunit 1